MIECGKCTECCKVLKVPERKKGLWEDCPGRIDKKGCFDYIGRPRSCREYACLYAMKKMPTELRPDNLGAILTIFAHTPDLLVVHATKPWVWTTLPLRQLLGQFRKENFRVKITTTGTRKT